VGVSANFGMGALASDTGNSIRGPASHAAVVGLRPTLGISSRFGIVPARHVLTTHKLADPVPPAFGQFA
jgi:Asp-tRNA(Asn)/Glu-tRNA(Gln) amidotransferase A subunit family amidase